MPTPHSTRHWYTGGTKPFPHCTRKMRAIAYLNHKSPSILMHSRGLRISNLIRDTDLAVPQEVAPVYTGVQSPDWRFPKQKAGRAPGSQLRQPGHRNNQISQKFSVKTSLEGSENFDVGGSSVIELRCGRQWQQPWQTDNERDHHSRQYSGGRAVPWMWVVSQRG